jgi:2-dehydropantoate 2-reductase
MHHAILGAGGVGGLVGAILGQAGHRVTLVLRPATFAVHPDTLTLASPLGSATAPVTRATALEVPVDVLWVTVKATQLDAALQALAHQELAGRVVPLLNGVDHMALLRARFGDRVVAATFAGETERLAPGRIVHSAPFARFAFHASGAVVLAPAVQALTAFGCSCTSVADEATLLWRKLVLLAPFALTTTGLAGTIGEVREAPWWHERLEACAREACAVARGSGADVDTDLAVQTLMTFPAPMRSSMQKDVAALRPPELDAIAGPILRGGARQGIAAPVTAELAALVAGRAGVG